MDLSAPATVHHARADAIAKKKIRIKNKNEVLACFVRNGNHANTSFFIYQLVNRKRSKLHYIA